MDQLARNHEHSEEEDLTADVSSPPNEEEAAVGDMPLTEDAFLGGRFSLLQPKKGFRAGFDSVFLAAAVPCAEGERIFEAGIGAGAVALCLLERVPGLTLTGVERSPFYALLAEKNMERNGMKDRVSVIQGNLRYALSRDLALWPPHGTFDHVCANPPFFKEGEVMLSTHILTSQARVFKDGELALWMKVLHAMVKPRGTATVIIRSETLPDVLQAMEGKFGGIKVLPIYPYAKSRATRLIVQGIKGSRAPVDVLSPFFLHREDGSYTAEAEGVLRDGDPIILP